MVLVTKNGSVKLLCCLSSDLRAIRRRAEATTEKLAEQEAKLRELDLKHQLMAEESWNAGDFPKRLDAELGVLESSERNLESR